MPLSEARFEQHLAAGALAPVYLLAGSDPLALLEAADALRSKARAQGFTEREVFEADHRFDGRGAAFVGGEVSGGSGHHGLKR